MPETKQARQRRARRIVAALEQAYPESRCALDHEGPFQLLVATMLSAQSTDLAVNRVTPHLFAAYPDAASMARADVADVGRLISALGLWRNKARHLVAAAQRLVADHDGEVPADLEALTALPGVGKKTATAVLGTAFGIAAGITVDTHMLRIHALLRLVPPSARTDADRMSAALEEVIPRSQWTAHTHRVIDHGRLVCVARRPRCGVCVLAPECPSARDARVGYKPAQDAREPASAAGLSWRRGTAPKR